MCRVFICLFLSFYLVALVTSHGNMRDPINRASRWREDSSAIPNYNDNELFCGGYTTQWQVNGGKCGLCGDNYKDKTPRAHEFGGKYGQGVIVKSYKSGGTLPVSVLLTQSHKGYFTWDLCNMDIQSESDSCFSKNKLRLTNGDDKFYIKEYVNGYYYATLRIPKIKCAHCVLRWTYRAGNNWGSCGNGTEALGCGPQEHFRGCADISIKS